MSKHIKMIGRLKDEILSDHKTNGYRDGHYSLIDCFDVENISAYKTAANTINDDDSFPYTVLVQRIEAVVKVQYSPKESKFYEYRTPSEVIDVLERLIKHIERLDNSRGIAHSTYVKQGDEGIDIRIEGTSPDEALDIKIVNTLKST